VRGDQRALSPLARAPGARSSVPALLISSCHHPARRPPADSPAPQAMPGAQRRWPGREAAPGLPRLAARKRARRTPSYERQNPTSLAFMPHARSAVPARGVRSVRLRSVTNLFVIAKICRSMRRADGTAGRLQHCTDAVEGRRSGDLRPGPRVTCQGSRTWAAAPVLPPSSRHVSLSSVRSGDSGPGDPIRAGPRSSVFIGGADRRRQGRKTGTCGPRSSGRVAGWAELTPGPAGGGLAGVQPAVAGDGRGRRRPGGCRPRGAGLRQRGCGDRPGGAALQPV